MAKDIYHIGTPRHSGRYPFGSGGNPQQRNKTLLGTINELHKQGLSDAEIAKGKGISSTELRRLRTIENAKIRSDNYSKALAWKDKGYSNGEIAKRLGLPNESSVRSLLDPVIQARSDALRNTANFIKEQVDTNKYIDIGIGVERSLGVSRTNFMTAVTLLQQEGYNKLFLSIPQLGTVHNTSTMVLAPPGSEEDKKAYYSELFKDSSKIKTIGGYSEDGGKTFLGLEPIKQIDSNRIKIKYAEEGGIDKDGVIELRRGVEDISLGEKRYAQVRIGVDGTHYLKGMAIYNDNLPEGVDIVFNTNKSSSVPKDKVFKKIEDDADNPFGTIVRQKHYTDSNGKKQLSALNIVGYTDTSGEEGAWGEWSRNLSSQMLSKQHPDLAKRQLNLAYDIKKDEFNEIMSFNNPTVRKMLLESFAEDADAASVHLKAAALPRQKTHVLLPLPSMKETEIYAPGYRDGEQVVLIRHPHGGTFEIPQLKVNNNNKEGIRYLGNAKDAVGISPKVASILSGADFDGDTVLVIPNPPRVGIKTTAAARETDPALKRLSKFDPKEKYPAYPGMPVVSSKTGFQKPRQMGSVSNLITDMTIKGATIDEIVRAVKHSMVVIDAEKHNLDYKKSYEENGIAALKTKYQGGSNKGASTLISKANSRADVELRKNRVDVDPKTGKKIYTPANETYVNKKGKIVKRTMQSKKMAEVDDAFELSSGTRMEAVYAEHANKLKALANTARLEALNTGGIKYSPSANKAYAANVDHLKAQLNIALKNAPLERSAQRLATAAVKAKKLNNPDMEPSTIKKLNGLELTNARLRLNAKKEKIIITDKDWEAIQAGAISNTTLTSILKNTDPERIKELATPRTKTVMTPAKTARAETLFNNGYTQAEVADALGVSTSTLSRVFK